MREPGPDDVRRRLQLDNPWWTDAPGFISRLLAPPFRHRSYLPAFRALALDMTARRAVVLLGPRRVGKTVMVWQTIGALLARGVSPDRVLYATLDAPIYDGWTLDTLVDLFRGMHGHPPEVPLYVFLDEIQYHDDWARHLKVAVDTWPHIRFVVSGSAAAALKRESTQSGAGRLTEFLLPPLNFFEFLRFRDQEALYEFAGTRRLALARAGRDELGEIEALNTAFIEYLNFGGYPEVVLDEAVRQHPERFILQDIIGKVLLKDLPSLYGIDDTQELNRFFMMLAFKSGLEVSFDELASKSQASKNTLRRYLEYLEAAFLITRLDRVDRNAARFKRAVTFKVYLTNPSLRAALFGPLAADDDGIGHLVETAVVAQLGMVPLRARLSYARDSAGEIDLVELDAATQKPVNVVEVKWSDRALDDRRLLETAVDFVRRHGLGGVVALTRTELAVDVARFPGVQIDFMPVAEYCARLGAMIDTHPTEGRPHSLVDLQPFEGSPALEDLE